MSRGACLSPRWQPLAAVPRSIARMDATTRLLIDRQAFAQTRIDALQPPALREGEARFAIRRIALTANNVTYAVFGDAMRYWDFFPSGTEGQGLLPVWGFAEVVASAGSGLDIGERVYGYWPLASHAVLQPTRLGARAFVDGAPHRAELAAAYQHYMRCAADEGYRREDEPLLALIRPLFTTSWLLADFLKEKAGDGPLRIVFSSASSKTAYGCAFALQPEPQVQRIALTSPGNRGFVDALGCYDASLVYDDLEAGLRPGTPTIYVDFLGDAALRARLHHHLGDSLVHDAVIGATQAVQPAAMQPHDRALPGPRPAFFFAPAQLARRAEAWGQAELQRRIGSAQRDFVAQVRERGWIEVVEEHGIEAAQRRLGELLAGRVDPRRGTVIDL